MVCYLVSPFVSFCYSAGQGTPEYTARPFAAMSQEELRQELTQANQRMDEQRRLTQVDVYAAQQRLWFETDNSVGRGFFNQFRSPQRQRTR